MRGIRGATTVECNDKEEIWQAAQELVRALVDANGIAPEDIGAAIFSVTEDLTAAFPSTGARRLRDLTSFPYSTRANAPLRTASPAASAPSSSSTRIVHKKRCTTSTCAAPRDCARIWRSSPHG